MNNKLFATQLFNLPLKQDVRMNKKFFMVISVFVLLIPSYSKGWGILTERQGLFFYGTIKLLLSGSTSCCKAHNPGVDWASLYLLVSGAINIYHGICYQKYIDSNAAKYCRLQSTIKKK